MDSANQREDRRQIILEAALKLIAAGGVDSISHRKVAAAAGVPLGSTTYYFTSREHLIQASFDHYLTLYAQMRSHLRIDPHQGPQALVEFAVNLTELAHQRLDLLRAEYEMTLFAARNAELAQSVRAWEAHLLEELGAVLGDHGVSSPQECARAVLQMLRGFEVQSLLGSDPTTDSLRQQLTMLIRAYQPQPDEA